MTTPKRFTKLWYALQNRELAEVGVSQQYWTPVLDTGDVVLATPSADLANLSVEVSGLLGAPAALTLLNGDVVDIADGMLVIFNLTGHPVGVIGVPAAP